MPLPKDIDRSQLRKDPFGRDRIVYYPPTGECFAINPGDEKLPTLPDDDSPLTPNPSPLTERTAK